jgi:putative hydrolase of the HAD superfamily
VERLHLIFDADDTLWEDNVFYERVVDAFVGWLEHPVFSRQTIRDLIDADQLQHAPSCGYGSAAFGRSLKRTYCRIAPARSADLQVLDELLRTVMGAPRTLIPGVPETLERLSAKHDLLLLTKGDRAEQSLKIEQSGLAGLFRRILVVSEKNEPTLRALIANEELDPVRTWVIGNSPRSDIAPAMAVGLRAVYVHNTNTWQAEALELAEDPRILRLPTVASMVEHF